MSTNTMMGKYVTATRNASGNVVGLSAGGENIQYGTQQLGDLPNRVFTLGDSLTMRQFRSASGMAFAESGTDVTLTLTNNYATAGSIIRVINQANAALNIDVPVVSNTSSNFVVRYPFDITGLFAGTVSAAIYNQGNDTGWINYVAALLAAQGKPINIVRNCGDGGDTIAEMLARLPTELIPLIQPGDIVAVLAGTNDLEVTTTAEMISGLKSIYDQLLDAGATVHAGTITQAQAAARFTDAAAALAQISAVNGYIRGRCKLEARMRCFDGHAALGSGDYASAGSVETDGVHYLPAGAQLIAAQYISDCGADYRKATFWRWLTTADNYVDATSKNLLTNCDFAGATGSTPPTGWSASGSGTRTWTLVAHPDGLGSDLQLAKTHSAAAQTSLSQGITSKVSAGDRLIFGTEMETVTVGEGHYLAMIVEITVSGVVSRHTIGSSEFSYANGGRMATAGTRYAHEKTSDANDGRNGVVIPAGFSAVNVKYLYQLGASGGFTAKVARPYVYKV